MRKLLVTSLFVLCAACTGASETEKGTSHDDAVNVLASEFDAPEDAFRAVEPSTLGLVASPTIWEAVTPIGKQTPSGYEGDESMHMRIKKGGDGYFVDIIHSGLLDDSVEAEHIRLELRLEPEGWFITNAWTRSRCYRTADPSAWQTQPCL